MATRAPVRNTLKLDSALCINCGMCLDVCPHGVFGAGPDSVAIVNADGCMECGACQRNCPTSAVTVDAGVGCASAMIRAAIMGGEPTCGDACCGGGQHEPAGRGSGAGCCGGDSTTGRAASCCGEQAEPAAASGGDGGGCCGGESCCG